MFWFKKFLNLRYSPFSLLQDVQLTYFTFYVLSLQYKNQTHELRLVAHSFNHRTQEAKVAVCFLFPEYGAGRQGEQPSPCSCHHAISAWCHVFCTMIDCIIQELQAKINPFSLKLFCQGILSQSQKSN